MNRNDRCAQLLHGFYRRIGRGSFCTVHHHLDAGQIYIDAFDVMVDVFFPCIRTIFDLADPGADRHGNPRHIALDQRFNFVFQRIGQLVPAAVKKLDSVEFHGIMGSGNDHAGVHLVFVGQIGHRRGRQNPQIDDIGSYRAGSRHQRIC